jgi:hypothetical protein
MTTAVQIGIDIGVIKMLAIAIDAQAIGVQFSRGTAILILKSLY